MSTFAQRVRSTHLPKLSAMAPYHVAHRKFADAVIDTLLLQLDDLCKRGFPAHGWQCGKIKRQLRKLGHKGATGRRLRGPLNARDRLKLVRRMELIEDSYKRKRGPRSKLVRWTENEGGIDLTVRVPPLNR